MRKIRITFIIVSFLLLLLINSVFYCSTKNTLEENQKEKVDLSINLVKSTFYITNETENYFNDLLSSELRDSSLVIERELPPNIEKVTNQQLRELANKLKLEGISLLVKKNNHITIKKSTLSKAIGVSTDTWGNWYTMMNELMKYKDVTIIPGFGEKYPNFWSGPIREGRVDNHLVSKWGFYYDGTTDYMINPFIDNKRIQNFDEKIGVNQLISKELQMNSDLCEISILNQDVWNPENDSSNTENRGGFVSNQLVVYGTYHYKSDSDKIYTAEALKKKQTIQNVMTINGKKVLRDYVPVSFKNIAGMDDTLIIIVTSNYQVIQQSLYKEIFHTALISLVTLIGAFLILYNVVILINRKERTIFNVQEMYSKHIESLFKTIKESRHDMKHHLFTISGLVNLKLYSELQEYVENLLGIQNDTYDLLLINIPAFSGLLQSKIAEAHEKNISFEHHFENFHLIQLDMMKMTNLVRITGNILDNAFHAVAEKEEDRRVVITGRYQKGVLFVSIYNNGTRIPEEHLKQIFSHGFTTRKGRGGNGLGLSSSKKIIEGYKGAIRVNSDEKWTKFYIELPLMSKEILKEPDKMKKQPFKTKNKEQHF